MDVSLIYINGTSLPHPTKYDVLQSDLDSSDTTRNERGVLLRNRVRQGVLKINLSWTLRGSQVATLLSLVVPDKFTVRYIDLQTFTYKEAIMYAGDRTCNLKYNSAVTDPKDALWDISFNLIEY